MAPRSLLFARMGHRSRKCGEVYAEETIFMNDAGTFNDTGKVSMRRTLLTLLGAVAAFGILTASYATAELPAEMPVSSAIAAPSAG